MGKVTLGLLQHACGADPAANLTKTLALADEAARRGAQIICTQELFARSISARARTTTTSRWPRRFPGPSTEAFQQAARRSAAWSSSPRSSRSARAAFITTPRRSSTRTGRSSGIYRKMHIPDDPLFYEKFYFTPGRPGFRSWKTKFGKIGVLICWDQWYPEAARLTALQGAEILFYPTAIGWHPGEKKELGAGPARRLGDRSSAATPSPTAATWRCNRIGHEKPGGRRRASNSGARASWPARAARSSREPRGQGGDPPRTRRPRRGGRHPHPLALPARPPHRRLRRPDQALHRLRDPAMPAIQTPAALGFRMPAEWEPQEATWLSWPRTARPGPAFPAIPRMFAAHRRRRSAGARRCASTSPRRCRSARVSLIAQAGADLDRSNFRPPDRTTPGAATTGRSSCAATGRARSRDRLGLQRVGREISALRSRQPDPARASPVHSGCGVSRTGWCSRAARST